MVENIELIDFTEEEVSELQRYIETHVHHTILQRIYVLTEKPIEKCQSFTTICRILISCKKEKEQSPQMVDKERDIN